jgi:hypothetical protein
VAANDDALVYRELHHRFIVYAFAASEMKGHDPDELPHRAACQATALPFHCDVVTRLELMPFFEVHVLHHFRELLEGSRLSLNRLELRSWAVLKSTWQELELLTSWTVLDFGRQCILDTRLLQWSGLSN